MIYIKIYTVSFFGHRQISAAISLEAHLEKIIRELLGSKEYIEFLVGRDGDFDKLASSTVLRCKRNVRDDNSSLIWILPYPTAAYRNNADDFQAYYDEIEICESSAETHYKSAYQVRNRAMVDRSDLIIFCVERSSGGAYQTMKYAEKQGKRIINIAEVTRWPCHRK